jgi:hypothetical protein
MSLLPAAWGGSRELGLPEGLSSERDGGPALAWGPRGVPGASLDLRCIEQRSTKTVRAAGGPARQPINSDADPDAGDRPLALEAGQMLDRSAPERVPSNRSQRSAAGWNGAEARD